MALNITTFNVRGLNSPFKRSMLWRDICKSKADIVCLQETHLLAVDTPKLKHKRFPFIFHSTSDQKRAGVTILIKDTISFHLMSSIIDTKGRFIILKGTFNSKQYTILSLYAPNSHQLSFIRKTIATAKEVGSGGLIVCGDFNVVMNKSVDRSVGCHRFAQELQPLADEEELHDAWRYLNSTERDYSFYSSSKKTHSRIDFFLVDRVVLPHVVSSSIGYITWSDHAPVHISLNTGFVSSGRPPWRLNTYILKNPDNIAYISSQLREYFEINLPSTSSATILWCAHKAFIRGIFMQLAAREKKRREQKLSHLLTELGRADSAFKSNPNQLTESTLKDLRSQLRLLYLHKYDYNLAKMKWNFYVQGDRPGKLLAKRVKQYQAKSKIPYMFSRTGEKIYNPQDIANRFADYYRELYNIQTSETNRVISPESIDDFLSKISLPSLTPQQLEDLNAPVTLQEIQKVFRTSKLLKAPGPDGLPNEYLQTFSPVLAPHFQSVCTTIIKNGAPPAEMLKATISTIPKPGKTMDDPAHFRPISLLNSDIKFFSKIIANRLNNVLPELVSPDQVGFVLKRQARDGTRRILDLIQFATSSPTDAVLLSLDAEKAFDRVSWPYLKKVLSKFGFVGPIFDAITSLYTSPSASVFTSGFFSDPFPITNGTRQGCPLSPLIFALIMEPLAETIRCSSKISGIVIQKTEHKISLYADDVLLICSNPLRSIPELLAILDNFSQISYYKLNALKSSIFPLTNSAELKTSLSHFNFIWSNDYISYLGVDLTRSPAQTIQKNFQKLLTTYERDCKNLKQACISWIARISLTKMFLLPKFIYLCRTIPYIIPKPILQKLQSIVLAFIWDNKKSRINRKLLYHRVTSGGLGVPNLEAYNIAAILEPVTIFWDEKSSHRWSNIEDSSWPSWDTKDVLIAISLGLKPPASNLLSLSHLCSLWQRWVARHGWLHLTKANIPFKSLKCWSLPETRPGWETYGIQSLGPLYINDTLSTFEDISLRHSIPRSAFFQYLQIRHVLNSIQWPSKPIGELPFQKFLYHFKGYERGISIIYALQSQTPENQKWPTMLKWENELQKTFSCSEWLAASRSAAKLSHCINHKEIMSKIHLRWYMTPARFHHIKADASKFCWRLCGEIGTQLHMWWSCPRTAFFWREVADLLSTVLQYKVTLSPELAVLDMHLISYPRPYRMVLQHVLISARFVIAQNWNSPNPLRISEVIRRTNFQCHCEIKLSSSPLKSKAMAALWEPWVQSAHFS